MLKILVLIKFFIAICPLVRKKNVNIFFKFFTTIMIYTSSNQFSMTVIKITRVHYYYPFNKFKAEYNRFDYNIFFL